MKLISIAAITVFSCLSSGCAIEQYHRDSLRYSSTDRGSETYRISSDSDSLQSAITRNNQEINLYRQHHQITYQEENSRSLNQIIADIKDSHTRASKKIGELPDGNKSKKSLKTKLVTINDNIRIVSDLQSSNYTNKDDRILQAVRQLAVSLEYELKSILLQLDANMSDQNAGSGPVKIAIPSTAGANSMNPSSQVSWIWPEQILNEAKSTQTATEMKDGTEVKKTEITSVDHNLLRALSSTASISQMRDLLTEPSFPSLLPVQRNTKLGCLPPPDSAAFEASIKLKALVEKKDKNGQASLDAEYATSVVKLFEESERTLFLQYALFRLCEMSINAPSGFRNVYPVVVHDIVRRTAEMNELANKEAEQRRMKEEETNQKKIDLKMKELDISNSSDAAKRAKEQTELEAKTIIDKNKNEIYKQCVLKKIDQGSTDTPEDISKNCKVVADIQ